MPAVPSLPIPKRTSQTSLLTNRHNVQKKRSLLCGRKELSLRRSRDCARPSLRDRGTSSSSIYSETYQKDNTSDGVEEGHSSHHSQIACLEEPISMQIYQMVAIMAIHRSMSTCPSPIKAFPRTVNWLLLPSKAGPESTTKLRLKFIEKLWYASEMHSGFGVGNVKR